MPLLVLVASVGCSGPARQARTEPRTVATEAAAQWHYRARLDPALSEMTVRACFDGPPPPRLVPIREPGGAGLVRASGPQGAALPVRHRRIELEGVGRGQCVQYVVDLARAEQQSRYVRRRGQSFQGVQSSWLWRPDPLPPRVSASIRFDLPDGVSVIAPWSRRAGAHRLDRSAFTLRAHVAFGRFEVERIALAGGALRVARLDGAVRVDAAGIRDWLRHAGRAVSTLFGRFPVDEAAVIVVPVEAAAEPVPFGLVRRGGGPSIMLLLGADASADELVGEWVAIHELSHLTMPLLRRRDAWLSEGIATYYQEVARARAGLQSPLQAWRNIDDGFRRGRADGTGRPLVEESARMRQTHAFRRVYWAGTAFALEADLRLRARSNGRQSLDRALATIRPDWQRQPGAWSAPRLLRLLDEATGTRLFTRLARQYLQRQRFPAVDELYAGLGLVRREDGLLHYAEDAPQAEVRDAIMQAPRPLAKERPRERSLTHPTTSPRPPRS